MLGGVSVRSRRDLPAGAGDGEIRTPLPERWELRGRAGRPCILGRGISADLLGRWILLQPRQELRRRRVRPSVVVGRFRGPPIQLRLGTRRAADHARARLRHGHRGEGGSASRPARQQAVELGEGESQLGCELHRRASVAPNWSLSDVVTAVRADAGRSSVATRRTVLGA